MSQTWDLPETEVFAASGCSLCPSVWSVSCCFFSALASLVTKWLIYSVLLVERHDELATRSGCLGSGIRLDQMEPDVAPLMFFRGIVGVLPIEDTVIVVALSAMPTAHWSPVFS